MEDGHEATCVWHYDPDEPMMRDGRECGAPCTCWCTDGKHLDCWCEEHAKVVARSEAWAGFMADEPWSAGKLFAAARMLSSLTGTEVRAKRTLEILHEKDREPSVFTQEEVLHFLRDFGTEIELDELLYAAEPRKGVVFILVEVYLRAYGVLRLFEIDRNQPGRRPRKSDDWQYVELEVCNEELTDDHDALPWIN